PIIANDLPFLRDTVAGNDFGVVRKLDTAADIAAAIDRMFEASGTDRERFRRSLMASGNRFAWSVEEEKLLALYRPFVPSGRALPLRDATARPSSARTQAFTG